jgi:hypothetical protein
MYGARKSLRTPLHFLFGRLREKATTTTKTNIIILAMAFLHDLFRQSLNTIKKEEEPSSSSSPLDH